MIIKMKRNLRNMVTTSFSTKNISTIFYVLALVPLILISISYATYLFGVMIPLYGYILLVIKKHKLFSYQRAGTVQKLFGLIVVFASFFAYFFVSPFIPNAVFYGFANYTLYLLGLFLAFFEIHALKEAFSPLFLVLAFVTSSIVSNFAELLFTPFIPQFTSFNASILRALGIPATYSSFSSNIITLNTVKEPVQVSIVWACVGFATMYIFSIILVVVMAEEPSNIKTKVIWAIVGVLGTFFINLLRLTIVLAGYSYGYEYGNMVHPYIGYILFLAWSAMFLYIFSKRNVISQKMKIMHAKI
jgi:exosortase/archaeosortase family protein